MRVQGKGLPAETLRPRLCGADFAMDIPRELWDLFEEFDFAKKLPADGKPCNMILHNVRCSSMEYGEYHGDLLIPGLPTKHAFDTKNFRLDRDQRTDFTISFRSTILPDKLMTDGDRLYLHQFVRQSLSEDCSLMVPTTESFVFPMDKTLHSMTCAFEPFSGGYGGWSHAFDQLEQCGLPPVRMVALDSNLHAAVQYSLSHRSSIVGGHSKLPWDLLLSHRENIVINMDFSSSLWRQALVILDPDFWLISSPCQPWSSSGQQRGFMDWNGIVLAETWAMIRTTRPAVVAMEQVPAFRTHQQYELFLWIVQWSGYRMVHMETSDIKEVTACKRLRYLAVFVACEFPYEEIEWTSWPHKETRTPRSMKAYLNLTTEECKPFQPSMSAASKYFNLKFAPESCGKTKKALINFRIPGIDAQQPTYMYMYGQQHRLDERSLCSKGLYGIFKSETENTLSPTFRFWSPLEILAQHVHRGETLWLKPAIISWQNLGNLIALPHSLKVAYDVHQIIATTPLQFPFAQIFDRVFQERIQFPETYCSEDEFAWYAGPMLKHHDMKMRVSNFWKEMDWKGEPFPVWPDGKLYHHDKGLTCFGDFTFSEDFCQDALRAPASIPTILDSLTATQPYEVELPPTPPSIPKTIPSFVEVQVAFAPGEYGTFTVEKGMPINALLALWNFECEPLSLETIDDSPLMTNAILLPTEYTSEEKAQFHEELEYIPILERTPEHLSIRAAKKSHSMDSFLIDKQVSLQLYDQFGNVDILKAIHTPSMFERQPVIPAVKSSSQDTFPALYELKIEHVIPKMTDILVFVINGPEESVHQCRRLWQEACPEGWLSSHGRTLNWQLCDNGELRLLFRPRLSHPSTPLSIFHKLILGKFVQFHMSQYACEDTGIQVKIKAQGSILFDGRLPDEFSFSHLRHILRLAFHSRCFGRQLNLVANGKAVQENMILGDLPRFKRDPDGEPIPITLHVLPITAGGGISDRQKQHKAVYEAVSQLFIQAGCKMPKVQNMVDELIEQVGMSRLSYLVHQESSEQMPSKFEELCRIANITIPGKPRSKAIADGKFRRLQLKTQNKQEPLDISQLAICEGYFENEDGTQATIASTFSPFTTGVSLLTPDQINMWLQGEKVLSGDELGAFVPEPCQNPVGFKYHELTVPVHNPEGQLLLLRGKLFQFGSKELRVTKKLNQSQNTDDVKIVAFTMWRKDYEETVWRSIAQQPVRMCKQMLQQQDSTIQILQPWGRRYRDARGETTPDSCESIQFHALVPGSCYPTLIKRSGWNQIYATPKTPDGQLVDSFRVIWTNLPLAELQTKIAAKPGCQGLIKGKRSFGVRVDVSAFESIWEALKPGQTPPDLTPLSKTFRLEPLPYGVNKEALQEWALKHQWKIRALKSVGGRQWLVGSNEEPTSHLLQFNGVPILIRAVQPKLFKHHGPVLAGKESIPKPSATPYADGNKDPWLEYRKQNGLPTGFQMPVLPNASQPSSSQAFPGDKLRQERQASGPIAQQFDQQAARIASLEEKFEKLAESQAAQSKNIDERFEKMEHDFRSHADTTAKSVSSMQTELQRTITTAMQHQDQKLQSSLQEIKQLFLRGRKRKDTAEGSTGEVDIDDDDM